VLRKLWQRFLKHGAARARSGHRNRYHPQLDLLEDRTAPAMFSVAPGDVVGLIVAVNTANADGQSNTINLEAGSTYALTGVDNYWYGANGLPAISSNLTINGNGAVIERVSSTPFRFFYVSGGFDTLPAGQLMLENLTLEGGLARGGDGGAGAGGGGGGAGLGGAIFNQGTLNLTAVTLTDNTAQGGDGAVFNPSLVSGGGGGGLGGAGGAGATFVGLGDNYGGGGGGGFAGGGQSAVLATAGGEGGQGVQGLEGGFGGGTAGSSLAGSSSLGGNGGSDTSAGGGGGGGGFGTSAGAGSNGTGAGLGGLGSNAGDGGDGGSGNNEVSNAGGGGGAFGGGGGGGFAGGGGGGGGSGGGGGGGGFGSAGGGIGFNGGGGGFGGGGGGLAAFGSSGGGGGFGGGGGGGGGSAGFAAGAGSDLGGGGGAGLGGAIFNVFGNAQIINSTLASNLAQGGLGQSGSKGGGGFGGALFNLNATINLINDTLDSNYVSAGNSSSAAADDLYALAFGKEIGNGNAVSTTVNLTNDILAGFSGGSDVVNNAQGTGNQSAVNVNGPNLVQQATSGTINGTFISGDPRLGLLQNNGGPAATMEVLPGSPVFANAGTAPTGNNGVPTSDQRGVSRGAVVELGAYQATTATQLAVSGFPSLATAGVVYQSLSVTAEDSFGKTVYNYAGTLSFTATGAARLPAPTAVSSGANVFGAALESAGVQALTVSDGALSGTQNGILVTPAAPTQIVALAGSAQSATVATAFQPLQALVTDQFNNPVSGVTVTFSVLNGGTLAIVSTTNGIASTVLTAGQGAGTFTVTASASGITSPADFVLTSTPGTPAKLFPLGFSSQIAPMGTVYSDRLQAQVTDQFGNPVPNVAVTFTAPTSGASGTFDAFFAGPNDAPATAASVTTDTRGIATAPTFTANDLPGSFTVTAAVAGIATPGNFSMTNTDVPASIRVVQGANQHATVGSDFALALAVLVTDSAGKPVTNFPVFFAAPTSGAGVQAPIPAFLTDAHGFVVTSKLTANDTAGTFTITVWVAPLTSPARFTLTNRPLGPSAVNVFAGNTQSATVGKAFANRLEAQVADKFGNPLSGVPVTFTEHAAGGAGGTFAGKTSISVVTGADGVAMAPVLTANSVAGSFDVTASIKKVTAKASFSLTNMAAHSSVVMGFPDKRILELFRIFELSNG